jgi:Choline dehydrogenase and related flavoproteins
MMFLGWLSITVSDASWAKNESLSQTRILKKIAELTGQDPKKAAELVSRDILEVGDDVDETVSFYNMAFHATAKGERSSPNSYIRATLADPAGYPLTVKLHALVTRVLFDNATLIPGSTPRAIGVEVMTGPSLYRADPKHVPGTKGPISQIYAKREVIISGGVFNSPQILKLSGVGPAEELKKFGIPVVVDLPGVGENLGDNYEGSLLGIASSPTNNAGQITLLFRTPNAPTKKRNIYAWCGSFSFEGFWPGFPTWYGNKVYTCALVHLAPKSQAGSVKLRSANPQDTPEINFRFFEYGGDHDLQELVEAANILREAWKAAGEPMAPIEELHPCKGPVQPGSERCSDEEQKEYFKLQAYSHHASSTCAIGGDDDPMAVLDSKFRVRGVKGLRVVDASVFPVVPGAFPSCPTMMISVKAAENIIEEARRTDKKL